MVIECSGTKQCILFKKKKKKKTQSLQKWQLVHIYILAGDWVLLPKVFVILYVGLGSRSGNGYQVCMYYFHFPCLLVKSAILFKWNSCFFPQGIFSLVSLSILGQSFISLSNFETHKSFFVFAFSTFLSYVCISTYWFWKEKCPLHLHV